MKAEPVGKRARLELAAPAVAAPYSDRGGSIPCRGRRIRELVAVRRSS